MPDGRRTFGPILLLAGFSGSVLALAGTRPWFEARGAEVDAQRTAVLIGLSATPGTVASATALGLATLVCLGIVLVPRGRLRRALTVVGLVVALGGAVTVIDALRLPQELRDLAAAAGGDFGDLGPTPWFWVGALAAFVGVVAWTAAVRFVGHWPEMSRKYDAPGTKESPEAPQDDHAWWKALSEGRDPTALD